MKILMVNDDGIDSEWIVALAERLAAKGEKVTVCAPKQNQSATSHSITVRRAYRVEKREYPSRLATYYAVDGKPVDCVQVGLNYLKIMPDLIISGINDDKNLGSDCLYSGTVGAACEGAFNGVPSWAVSVYYEKEKPSDAVFRAVSFIGERFGELYEKRAQSHLLNINIPVCGQIRGLRYCRLAKTEYDMTMRATQEGVCLLGTPVGYEKAEAGTDIYNVLRGYATVTPLSYEMTDFNALGAMKEE